jgi:hypothetical protein
VSTVKDFKNLVSNHGTPVIFHRVDSTRPCPCRTPEGYRDPEWHAARPGRPVCNEQGMLPDFAHSVITTVKAFVQPAQSTRLTRLASEWLQEVFGEIQTDDHVGIFPCDWNGKTLNFFGWSHSGEDFIVYNGRKFMSVNANLIPDPADGNPYHHWEVALRLLEDYIPPPPATSNSTFGVGTFGRAVFKTA